MKNFRILLFLMLMAVLPLAAAELEAYLEPDTVLAGETFELRLVTDGERAQLLEAPQGFLPAGNTHTAQLRYGKRSVTEGYRFLASEPGEYTIPPLAAKIGGKTVKTPELKLKVLKADTASNAGEDDVTFQGSFSPVRTRFYVGEEITLLLTLTWPESLNLAVAYPAVDAGKAIFRDFRDENPRAPEFAPPRETRRVESGRRCRVITFPTVFRPLEAGALQVRSSIKTELRIPDKSRSRDSFFDDFDFFGNSRYQSIPRTLEVELPELDVVPLPPPPAGVHFLGLIGDYQGKAELSAPQAEASTPLTLTVRVQGGSLENLQIPQLTIDHFRVYPGEKEVKNGVAAIRYALIPLQAGKFPLHLAFATFAPQPGNYREITLQTELTVTPAAHPEAAITPALPGTPSQAVPKPAAPRTTLLYCKTAPGKAIQHPWYRNQLGAVVLLVIAGPLFFALHLWYRKRLAARSGSETYQRRERANRSRKALLDEVKYCADADLPKLVTGKITATLCDRLDLPQNSDPEAIAEKAHQPELAAILRQCNEASYLPPELAKTALPDAGMLRRILVKALKLFLLALLPLGITPAEGAETPAPATWSEALGAYDRGDIPAAREYFENQLRTDGEDPNVLYNLGCIAEAAGEPEKALWYLERARLDAPYDSATQENCNVLRRKFFLPEAGSSNTPGEMVKSWRDHWRPDHYLWLAALAWCLGWVAASFRHRLPAKAFYGVMAALGLILLLALIAGATQHSGSYRANRGVVIAKSAEVSTFPGAHNARKAGVLSGGTPVSILERRQEYLHVASGELEGWAKSHEIGELP